MKSKNWPCSVSAYHRWRNSRQRKDSPKISIVMPSYNQGRFIEETILSVLNQGYPNLEFIIIDGGSSDETVEIIRRYESRIAYWVSEKDHGQTHAVNKGLEKATGDIVGWINSDDIYLPWTFREVVRAFRDDADLGLVWGGRILIGEDTSVLGFSFPRQFIPESMVFCINSETTFWRRGVGVKVGALDESLRFAMDLDFFSRIRKRAKVGYINKLQGCFRCYGDNKSSTMQDVCLEETKRLWREHFGYDFVPRSRPDRRLADWPRVIGYPMSGLMPYLRQRMGK